MHVVQHDFKDKVAFIAQNIVHKDGAELTFDPYVIREQNGIPVGIIGQAFPYMPQANRAQFTPDWEFGIDEAHVPVPSVVQNQGGDMVRSGGLVYACEPAAKLNSRISDMSLNGHPIQADIRFSNRQNMVSSASWVHAPRSRFRVRER